MFFERCVCLWNNSHHPDIEHFHHAQKFPHVTLLSKTFKSGPGTKWSIFCHYRCVNFLLIYVNLIIYYVSFCISFFSLSTMFESPPSHGMCYLSILLDHCMVFHYVHINKIWLFVHVQFNFLQFCATINKIVMHILTQFFCGYIFFLLLGNYIKLLSSIVGTILLHSKNLSYNMTEWLQFVSCADDLIF